MERKTPRASLGFPRAARITRGAELQRITREGKRIRTEHIEVRVATSPFVRSQQAWQGMRIGLVVPKFKHSGVVRNQLKRRLRELARVRMLPLDIPALVVLRIRPNAYAATFDLLALDINRAIRDLERWYQGHRIDLGDGA